MFDVQLVELARMSAAVVTTCERFYPPGHGHPVLRARRHPRQREVALARLRDLAQADVPGRLGVLGELARGLVEVDVAVEDERRRERLAPAFLGCHCHASSLPA